MRKLLATQTQNGHEHLVTFSGVRKLLATQTQNGHKHLVTFSGVRKLLATQTQNGHKNLVTLIDDHAREESIHGPRDKSQIGQAFKASTFRAKPSTRQEVKILHSNGSDKRVAGHLHEVPHYAAPTHDTLPTHALDSVTSKDALSGNKLDIF